jgi:hypothetical protein
MMLMVKVVVKRKGGRREDGLRKADTVKNDYSSILIPNY